MFGLNRSRTQTFVSKCEKFEKRTSYNNNFVQKSASANSVVETRSGYRPSDYKRDPQKRQFLQNLSKQIWHYNVDEKGQAIPEHKPIDLQKLFTPAVDAVEIEPQKNRIMYSSSSFYSPNLHPTVEDQVQLARRISQSLSDISNEQSKGQSMYVNRKKRSVKWIHSGGEGGLNNSVVPQTPDFNNHHQNNQFQDENKPILKLIMDPRGHVQDLTSLKNQGFVIEPAALSPDICKDIVRSLNATKGKGAELFAKRRKKSEKWVVGESNSTTLQESAISISNQNVPPITSPLGVPTKPAANIPPLSYLQGSTERVQNVQKMNEIQERFNQPRVKLIKSPWEVALETGSVDGAFQENAQSGLNNLPPWTPNPNNYCPEIPPAALPKPYAHNPAYNSNSVNRIVENIQRGNGVVPTPNSIYKPKIPTGWSGSAGVIQPPNDNYSNAMIQSDVNIASTTTQADRPVSPFPSIPVVALKPNEELDEKSPAMRSVTPFGAPPKSPKLKDPIPEGPSPFPSIPNINQDPEYFEQSTELSQAMRPVTPLHQPKPMEVVETKIEQQTKIEQGSMETFSSERTEMFSEQIQIKGFASVRPHTPISKFTKVANKFKSEQIAVEFGQTETCVEEAPQMAKPIPIRARDVQQEKQISESKSQTVEKQDKKETSPPKLTPILKSTEEKRSSESKLQTFETKKDFQTVESQKKGFQTIEKHEKELSPPKPVPIFVTQPSHDEELSPEAKKRARELAASPTARSHLSISATVRAPTPTPFSEKKSPSRPVSPYSTMRSETPIPIYLPAQLRPSSRCFSSDSPPKQKDLSQPITLDNYPVYQPRETPLPYPFEVKKEEEEEVLAPTENDDEMMGIMDRRESEPPAEPPKKVFIKPPEAVIGARPLFGGTDVNKELSKKLGIKQQLEASETTTSQHTSEYYSNHSTKVRASPRVTFTPVKNIQPVEPLKQGLPENILYKTKIEVPDEVTPPQKHTEETAYVSAEVNKKMSTDKIYHNQFVAQPQFIPQPKYEPIQQPQFEPIQQPQFEPIQQTYPPTQPMFTQMPQIPPGFMPPPYGFTPYGPMMFPNYMYNPQGFVPQSYVSVAPSSFAPVPPPLNCAPAPPIFAPPSSNFPNGPSNFTPTPSNFAAAPPNIAVAPVPIKPSQGAPSFEKPLRQQVSQKSMIMEETEEIPEVKEPIDYKKVPVRSLIKVFEQSARPIMRYKQVLQQSEDENIKSAQYESLESSLIANEAHFDQIINETLNDQYFASETKKNARVYYPVTKVVPTPARSRSPTPRPLSRTELEPIEITISPKLVEKKIDFAETLMAFQSKESEMLKRTKRSDDTQDDEITSAFAKKRSSLPKNDDSEIINENGVKMRRVSIVDTTDGLNIRIPSKPNGATIPEEVPAVVLNGTAGAFEDDDKEAEPAVLEFKDPNSSKKSTIKLRFVATTSVDSAVRPLPPPTPPPIEIPSPPPRMDLSALNNYNTAPRGWNKASKEYYRPITFDPVKAVPKNASFTDF